MPVSRKTKSKRKKAPAELPTTPPLIQPPLQPDAEDAPQIPSTATAADAIRLRAVYDARKARLASLAEALRLDQERHNLWTTTQVRERDRRWNEVVAGRLDQVERLADGIDGVTPDQRKAFLAAARAWCVETKRALASAHA